MTEIEFPSSVESALRDAAHLLGDGLIGLGYPNGGKDAAFAEANILVYVAHGLLSRSRPFKCYSEPTHTRASRIDMVAFDGEVALAIEAKKFGSIKDGSSGIIRDVERLRDFTPKLAVLADKSPAKEWWQSAHARWGLVLVGSHGGKFVTDAWNAADAGSALSSLEERLIGKKQREAATIREGNAGLLEALARLDTMSGIKRGAFEICSGETWGCADASLLWAAFRLQ